MQPTDPGAARAGGGTNTATRAAELFLVAGALSLAGCDRAEPPLFELLLPKNTGVSFVNELPEAPEINIISIICFFVIFPVTKGFLEFLSFASSSASK